MTQQEKIKTDIIGNRYGRLTVISYSHNVKRENKGGYKHYYNCKCDCGNDCVAERSALGRTKNSCGCIHKEQLVKRNKSNALDNEIVEKYERLHRIWNAMKHRCENKNDDNYDRYGGREIKVCKEWHDWFKFKEWAINNGYSDELTIDRIDYNGDYEPNNCRWATYKTQANNTSKNKYIEYQGRTQTLTQWCEELDLPYNRTKARLNSCGMSVEEAFNKGYYKNDGSRDINKNNVYKDKGVDLI